MPRIYKATPELRAQAVEMYRTHTLQTVATAFGVSRSCVERWAHLAGVRKRPRAAPKLSQPKPRVGKISGEPIHTERTVYTICPSGRDHRFSAQPGFDRVITGDWLDRRQEVQR